MVPGITDLCGNVLTDASENVLIDACNNFIPEQFQDSENLDISGVQTSADPLYVDLSLNLVVTLEDCTSDSVHYLVQFPTDLRLDTNNYSLSNPTITLYEKSGLTLSMISTSQIPSSDLPDTGSLSALTIDSVLTVSRDISNLSLYLEFTSELVILVDGEETDSHFINLLNGPFIINPIPNDLVVQVLVDDASMNYIDGIPLRIINPNASSIEELWVKVLNFDGSGTLHSQVFVLNDTTDTLETDIFPIPQDASRNFQFIDNLVADTEYFLQVKALYNVSGTIISSKYTAPIKALFTTRVGTVNVVNYTVARDESEVFLPESVNVQFTLPFDATRYGREVTEIVFSHQPITINSPFHAYSTVDPSYQVLDLSEATDTSGVYTYRVDNFTGDYDASANLYIAAFADTRYGKQLTSVVPANTRRLAAFLSALEYEWVNRASDFDGSTINDADIYPVISFSLDKGSDPWPFEIPSLPLSGDLLLAALERPFAIQHGTIQSMRLTAYNPLNGGIQGRFTVQLNEGHTSISCTPSNEGISRTIDFDGNTAYAYQRPPSAVSAASITSAVPATTTIIVSFAKGTVDQDGTGAIVYTRYGIQGLDEGSTIIWNGTGSTGTSFTINLGSFLRNKSILLQSYTADLNKEQGIHGDITVVDFEADPAIDSLVYVGYNYPVEGSLGTFAFTATLEQYGMEDGQVLEIFLYDGSGVRLYYDTSNNELTTTPTLANPLIDSSGTVASNALASITFELRDSITNWSDFNDISVRVVNLDTEQESPLYLLKKQNGTDEFVYTLMPVPSVTPLVLSAADSIISTTFTDGVEAVQAQLSYGDPDLSYQSYSSGFSAISVNLTANTASYIVTNDTLDGGDNSYVKIELRAFIYDPNTTVSESVELYSETTSITGGPIDFVFEAPVLTMAEPDKAPPQVTYTVTTTTPNNTTDASLNVNAIIVMTDASSAVTCFDVSPNTSYAIVVHKDAAEDPELVPCSVGEANILYVRQPNLDYTVRDLRVWFVSDASSASYPTNFNGSFVPALPSNANTASTTQAFQPYKQIELLAVGDYDVGDSERFDISMNLNGDFPSQLTFVYFYQNDKQYTTHEYENLTPLNIDTKLYAAGSSLPMFSGTTTLNGVLALTMEWSLADNVAAIFVFGVGTGRPVLDLDGYSFFGSYTLPYVGTC